jgi:hypothetical protein
MEGGLLTEGQIGLALRQLENGTLVLAVYEQDGAF